MTDFIRLNKETYNTIAQHFSLTRAFVWDDLKPLKRYMKDTQRVLDLGSGNGRLYQLFSDLSIDYTGADQSEGLIAEARKKFPGVHFDIAEMTELPYADASFDVVYCIAAFQHLPDQVTRLKALAEMRRVTVSGGYIIMTNWNLFSQTAYKRHPQFAPGDFMIPWKDPKTGETVAERYYHGFTMEELSVLFDRALLTVEGQYYSRKGKETSKEDGTNIVSIIKT